MATAKLQAISGAGFALFLALHLATTASGAVGPASYDGTLSALRAIYRSHPLVEFLLIGATAFVHVACGVIQFVRRRRLGPQPKPEFRLRLHRWAGYFLMIAFAGHVYATRVMPALGSGAADYAYLSFSVLAWPAMIIPYYFALGLAGAVHFGLGLGFAASTLTGLKSRRASVAVAWGAGILVTAGVAGIVANAASAERRRFPEYRELYERYLPVMPRPAAATSSAESEEVRREAPRPLPPSPGRW